MLTVPAAGSTVIATGLNPPSSTARGEGTASGARHRGSCLQKRLEPGPCGPGSSVTTGFPRGKGLLVRDRCDRRAGERRGGLQVGRTRRERRRVVEARDVADIQGPV